MFAFIESLKRRGAVSDGEGGVALCDGRTLAPGAQRAGMIKATEHELFITQDRER